MALLTEEGHSLCVNACTQATKNMYDGVATIVFFFINWRTFKQKATRARVNRTNSTTSSTKHLRQAEHQNKTKTATQYIKTAYGNRKGIELKFRTSCSAEYGMWSFHAFDHNAILHLIVSHKADVSSSFCSNTILFLFVQKLL